MATYTENYNLEKPAQSDLYNVDVFNENADKIDEALGDKAENQSLAPIESSSTASRNYSVGQQFVYNGLLYEATAAIASGGTITPGSNCARTTVAEELSALNNGLTKLSPVLLWTNPSPSADFSQNTLTFTSFSNYSYVCVAFKGHKTYDNTDQFIVNTSIPNTSIPRIWSNVTWTELEQSKGLYNRAFQVGTSTIDFKDAFYCNPIANTITKDNTRLIPLHIYGVNSPV